MNALRKRNLSIAIAAFVIGIAVVSLLVRHRSVNGQVASYLLDERGAVTGLLLANGDQLRFGPEMGEAVAAKVKVGDTVTATGDAGSGSSYGREIRVKQLTANGQTITDAERPPRPHGGPKEPKGQRPAPPAPGQQAWMPMQPDGQARPAPPTGQAAMASGQTALSAGQAAPPQGDDAAPPSPAETISATGTIAAHLIGARGEVNGLILSGGEQLRFSPEVGELVVAAEKNGQTQVSVEGAGVRNEHGTIIRPMRLTIGNQTIALDKR
jgi:hypothetical protein